MLKYRKLVLLTYYYKDVLLTFCSILHSLYHNADRCSILFTSDADFILWLHGFHFHETQFYKWVHFWLFTIKIRYNEIFCTRFDILFEKINVVFVVKFLEHPTTNVFISVIVFVHWYSILIQVSVTEINWILLIE